MPGAKFLKQYLMIFRVNFIDPVWKILDANLWRLQTLRMFVQSNVIKTFHPSLDQNTYCVQLCKQSNEQHKAGVLFTVPGSIHSHENLCMLFKWKSARIKSEIEPENKFYWCLPFAITANCISSLNYDTLHFRVEGIRCFITTASIFVIKVENFLLLTFRRVEKGVFI